MYKTYQVPHDKHEYFVHNKFKDTLYTQETISKLSCYKMFASYFEIKIEDKNYLKKLALAGFIDKY